MNLRNDRQHYQDGLFVFDVPTFNERATRELLLNAVSHRDYQNPGSVFVVQYRDRLTVKSPGGFLPGITPQNVLSKQAARNRRIAEILARCGLELGVIEKLGRGKYVISRRYYFATGKSGVHTRKSGLDRETNKALLLKHIELQGDLGATATEFQQVLPALTRHEIRNLIDSLRSNNQIERRGKNRGAHWFLAKKNE